MQNKERKEWTDNNGQDTESQMGIVCSGKSKSGQKRWLSWLSHVKAGSQATSSGWSVPSGEMGSTWLFLAQLMWLSQAELSFCNTRKVTNRSDRSCGWYSWNQGASSGAIWKINPSQEVMRMCLCQTQNKRQRDWSMPDLLSISYHRHISSSFYPQSHLNPSTYSASFLFSSHLAPLLTVLLLFLALLSPASPFLL